MAPASSDFCHWYVTLGSWSLKPPANCSSEPPPPPLGVVKDSVSNEEDAALPPIGVNVVSPRVTNVAVVPSSTVASEGCDVTTGVTVSTCKVAAFDGTVVAPGAESRQRN